MSFTVYVTSKIGASGVGLYQLIMTVYRLSVTLATGGIGLAAARLVSEETAVGSSAGAAKAVRSCLLYALTLSTAAGALLFAASRTVAQAWLGDIRTLTAIRILAFSLPALASSSVLCGYFTAVRRVAKSSGVLLLEQYIKISLSVCLMGIFAGDGVENACCALVLSSTVAEIISCMTLAAVYFFDHRKHLSAKKRSSASQGIAKRMLSIAVPVALTSYLRSGLSSVEQMMIPRGLKKHGLSENAALAEYGIIGGMVMPVIMFPAVFISAFSGLLVTETASLRAVGDKAGINAVFSRIFRFTMLFSIAVAGILCGFGGDIAMSMYKNERAADFIRILAPLVCVMYLDSVTDSMLKGLDLQQSHMRYNIIDSAISVFLTVTLLPLMGISGYIIVITVSETVNFLLSFRKLIKVTGFSPRFYENVVKPAICITLPVLIMRLSARFIPIHFIAAILLSLAIYLILLRALSLPRRENKNTPLP